MHVHVPEAATTHDHERVAELAEGGAQAVHRGLLGVDEVHHLVRAAALEHVVADVLPRERQRDRAGLAAYAGDGLDQGVEDHHEAAAAGVHDPGAGERLELLGRAGERVARGVGRSRDEADEAGAGPERRHGVGGGPRDREDRALLGLGDRGVRRVGGLAEGVDEHGLLVVGELVGTGERLGEPADELAEDDPGVAAGAEQGAVGEGADGVAQVEARAGVRESCGGGLEGQEQVGARVAVRHREHVERVDLGPVASEGLEAEVGPAPDPGGVEALEHGVAAPSGRWTA